MIGLHVPARIPPHVDRVAIFTTCSVLITLLKVEDIAALNAATFDLGVSSCFVQKDTMNEPAS